MNGRTIAVWIERRERRKYTMTNRRARVCNPRERGEPKSEKVTLESVLRVVSSGACKQNCLHNINPKYILEQQYMAWTQKYEARATWIQQMLNAFSHAGQEWQETNMRQS